MSPRCDWCGAPATTALRDERRTRMPSSTSTVKMGPGTRLEVCGPCAARLTARYELRREVL